MATAAATATTLAFGRQIGLTTRAERLYAATVVAAVGGWLAAATILGPLRRPLPAILTIGSVALLALIAGTVSYLHMRALVAMHGQPGWVAALTPLSVDGMIVAASTTLLADSRSGSRGGVLPWLLLAVGSVASLAANVAVAEPTVTGRVIAAWPSFALIGSYELLMRQVRRTAASEVQRAAGSPAPQRRREPVAGSRRQAVQAKPEAMPVAGQDLQRQAWQWALANRTADGSLPSGRAIAAQYGRHERWGRLVKRSGTAGWFAGADLLM